VGMTGGFETQVKSMSQYPELRDEAVGIAIHIADFPRRADILVQIGKQYLAVGDIEKGYGVLERAGSI
jgi:hypothetical protein